MPFDPFFSSANKRDFIAPEGGDELYHQIKSMPLRERKLTMWEWKKRGLDNLTEAEKYARRMVSKELNTRYHVKNVRVAEGQARRIVNAQHATHTITGGGYSGVGGHGRDVQHRGFRSKK